MKTLGIIGSGDLGKQIAHYAISDNHYQNVVFFDDFSETGRVDGFEVLGKISDVDNAFENKLFDELIIAIGYKHLLVKKQLYDKFHDKIPFGKIIHSSCWVDSTAIIEKGCVIYPGCVIDAHVEISANSILNVACTIAHDTKIQPHCFLSPRVAIAGFVNIEELCIIGINATLIDNLTVVSQTQIGGGTVVTKSILSKGLYVGNPAKFIR